MAKEDSREPIGEAIKVLGQKRVAERAEKQLERELEALDVELEGAAAVAGLQDTPVQRVQSYLMEWVRWDDQRAQTKARIDVAKAVGDKEEAKRFLTEQQKILKRLNAILLKLVETMAEEEEVREEVGNWQMVRVNLRPLLKKHLQEKYGVDVSAQLGRVEELEAEQRRLRRVIEE